MLIFIDSIQVEKLRKHKHSKVKDYNLKLFNKHATVLNTSGLHSTLEGINWEFLFLLPFSSTHHWPASLPNIFFSFQQHNILLITMFTC